MPADPGVVETLLGALGLRPKPDDAQKLQEMKESFPRYTGPMADNLTPGGPVVQSVVPRPTKMWRRDAAGRFMSRKPAMSLDLLIAKRGGQNIKATPKEAIDVMDWLTPDEQQLMRQVPSHQMGQSGTEWERLTNLAHQRVQNEDYLRNLPLPGLQSAVRQILKLRKSQ